MRRTVAATVLLAFSACAVNLKVRHILAPRALGADDPGRAERLYLVVKAEAPRDEGKSFLTFGKKTPEPTQNYRLSRQELDEFARRSAQLLSGEGVKFVGYQVHYGDDAPAAMEQFSPKASLWIEPSVLDLESSGKASTSTLASVRVRFDVQWKTFAEPGHAFLAQGRSPLGSAAVRDIPADKEDPRDSVRSRLWEMVLAYAKDLGPRLRPQEVTRFRSLYKGSGPSEQAYAAAKKGFLEDAARLWESATGSSKDWESRYNLGAYHEHRSELPEAKKSYQEALEARPGGMVGAQIRAILQELSSLTSESKAVERPAPTPLIYSQKIAVLPFTNESVDMGASEYLRLKVNEMLGSRGYPLLPLDELDRRLAEKDIREGGQLGLLSAEGLSAQIQAPLLLYGNILEFRVVNIGVYFKKEVALDLRLVDRQGALVWSNSARTVEESSVKPKEALAHFVVRLAETQVKKLAKTHLKAESDETVWRCLETLPQRL